MKICIVLTIISTLSPLPALSRQQSHPEVVSLRFDALSSSSLVAAVVVAWTSILQSASVASEWPFLQPVVLSQIALPEG